MKKLLTAATSAALLILTAAPAAAITNGTPDTTHNYVALMRGLDPSGAPRICSGSLIDKGVFLTAGHCTALTNVTLHFGADLTVSDRVFTATAVLAHPNKTTSFGKQFDVGVVLFDQGNAVLEIGRLAPANYVDGFSKAQLSAATFETIGYGLVRNDTTGNSGPLVPTTTRMYATQSYLNQHNQYLGLSINTNVGSGGGCSGDSGGPHLLNNYIVSVTSNGDANCVATDNTQRVDQPEIRDWVLSFTH
jgi:Trypsin